VHCGDEQLDAEFVAALAEEARCFLAEHGSELSDYERQALEGSPAPRSRRRRLLHLHEAAGPARHADVTKIVSPE
jgi:hypothetical protein